MLDGANAPGVPQEATGPIDQIVNGGETAESMNKETALYFAYLLAASKLYSEDWHVKSAVERDMPDYENLSPDQKAAVNDELAKIEQMSGDQIIGTLRQLEEMRANVSAAEVLDKAA